jgi:Family of unknown function (DUF6516)
LRSFEHPAPYVAGRPILRALTRTPPDNDKVAVSYLIKASLTGQLPEITQLVDGIEPVHGPPGRRPAITILSLRTFAEIVVWRAPKPAHRFKYRLAFVVDGEYVLRYDNETGKRDHRHLKGRQMPYRFVYVDELQTDFWRDIDEWSPPCRP